MPSWNEQLKDMENEDTYHEHLLSNKIYPNGLFNLTSNPIFNVYNEKRRIKAIINVMEHDDRINRRSILYDRHSHIVYFLTKDNLFHKVDLHTKQVRILNVYGRGSRQE